MKTRTSKLFGVGAAVLGLAVGAGSMAIAGASLSGNGPTPPGVVASSTVQQPAVTAPCHLWAVVNADGTLARTGCAGTTSAHLGTGSYQVIFPVGVRQCAYIATPGGTAHGSSGNPGFINVTGRSINTAGVYISSRDTTSTLADNSFHLDVHC